MSCQKKHEWVQMPSTKTPCVNEIGNDAVEQHNKAAGDKLVYKQVICGWFLEIDDETIKHRLYIEVINSKGDVVVVEVLILVVEKGGKRVRTLISCKPGYQDDKNPSIFWVKIPEHNAACVQHISMSAVEEHNKNHHDHLVYILTIEGWYHEVNAYDIRYKLYIKAKDCIGRVRDYLAIVLEEKSLSEKIRKLEYFKLIPKKC